MEKKFDMKLSVMLIHSCILRPGSSEIPINCIVNPSTISCRGDKVGTSEGIEVGSVLVEGSAEGVRCKDGAAVGLVEGTAEGSVEGGEEYDKVGAAVGGCVGATGEGVGGGAGSQPHFRRENICKARQLSWETNPS
jgi:hypothetical protein